MSNETPSRVIVALTETAPIDALWRVTSRWLTTPDIGLVTLYVADDRWQRAASLPFTREVPRTGGPPTAFTMQRAQQVHDAAVKRNQARMQQLAADVKLPLIFEIFADPDKNRLREIVGQRASVIIAPSLIAREPLFAILSQFDCRIELVDDSGAVSL